MRIHPLCLTALLLLLMPGPSMAKDLFEQAGIRTHGFHFLEGARFEIGSVSPDQGNSAAVFGLNTSAGTLFSPAFDLTLGMRYWNADLDLDDGSGSNGSLSDFSLHGDLNYHIGKVFGLRPYGLAGVGAHFVSADVPGEATLEDALGGFNLGLDLGIGVATAGKGLGFRGEIRREQVEEASTWNYTLGIGWWPGEKAVRVPKSSTSSTSAAPATTTTPASPPPSTGLSYAEAAAMQTTIERLTAENDALRSQGGSGPVATAAPSTPESRATAQREAFQRTARMTGAAGGYMDTPQGPQINLESLASFEEGGSKLDTRDLMQIRRIAVLLLMFPGTTANLEGHADATGGAAANQKVTTARAEGVRQELLRLGVPSGALSATGVGSSRPLAGSAPGKGQPADRRVSVQVSGRNPQ